MRRVLVSAVVPAVFLVAYSCTTITPLLFLIIGRAEALAITTVQRYRARVAYDGHGFSGFQLQTRKNCRTVQGVLEDVLNRRILGLDIYNANIAEQRVIKVVAASRTDSGVHARGQAIHFDVPLLGDSNSKGSSSGMDAPLMDNADDLSSVCVSLNQMLTPDVRLWNLQRVPPGLITKPVAAAARARRRRARLLSAAAVSNHDDFDDDDDDGSNNNDVSAAEAASNLADFQWNVLFDSTQKLYSYRLSLAPVMDPLERHTRWHPPLNKRRRRHAMDDGDDGCSSTDDDDIDEFVDMLRRILKHYEGTHDFRAFAGAVERAEKKAGGSFLVSTIRTVYSVDLIREDPVGGDEAATAAGGCGNNNNFRIDFRLKGALYKQVRNMVGTALDVCRGNVSEEEFLRLLRQEQQDDDAPPLTRVDNRSKPAPPEGLTLEMVYFDDPNF